MSEPNEARVEPEPSVTQEPAAESAVIADERPEDWHRLSPLAIIFFIIRFSIRFVKEGLMNFAPAFAVFITQVDDKLFWFGIGLTVIVSFVIFYSLLYFRTFKFLLEDDQVTLHRGVLKQEKTILKFHKIQNVNLSTPFYFSPFKLVNCIFDSAGSSQQEISFPGISLAFAENIRSDVMTKNSVAANKSKNSDIIHEAEGVESAVDANGLQGSEASTNAVGQESRVRLRLSIKDLVIYGLSSNMTFLLMALLAPFMEHIVDHSKNSIVPGLLKVLSQVMPSAGAVKATAVVIIILAIFLTALSLSIVSAIVQFYGFTFFDEGKNLKRTAGLLESHQISMSKHRVQAISIRQNWLMCWFKRVTVQFHQLASGHGANAKNKNNLAIPTLPQTDWPEFVSDSFAGLDVKKLHFLPISTRYISRVFLTHWFLPLALVSLLLMQVHPNWIWVNLISFIGLSFTVLRFKRFGLWFNDEFIAIRSGLFGNKISVIPLYKTQHISLKQTPMMRKNRLATIEFQLPFGTRSIPYVPLRTARAIINLTTYRIETTQKHWL
jgi:putative membrane protein